MFWLMYFDGDYTQVTAFWFLWEDKSRRKKSN
jgi:hypothetical protein